LWMLSMTPVTTTTPRTRHVLTPEGPCSGDGQTVPRATLIEKDLRRRGGVGRLRLDGICLGGRSLMEVWLTATGVSYVHVRAEAPGVI